MVAWLRAIIYLPLENSGGKKRTANYGIYHKGVLCAILGVGNDIRDEVIYILSRKLALQTYIVK